MCCIAPYSLSSHRIKSYRLNISWHVLNTTVKPWSLHLSVLCHNDQLTVHYHSHDTPISVSLSVSLCFFRQHMFCSTDVSETLQICPLYNLKKLLGQRAHPECSLSCVLCSCCEMTLTFLAFIHHRDLSLTFHSLSCLSELIFFSFHDSQSNLRNKCWAYSRTMHWCEFTHTPYTHTHTPIFRLFFVQECCLFW